MKATKAGYWINKDDVAFLKKHWRGRPGNNLPLLVYKDICREAARYYHCYPNGADPLFKLTNLDAGFARAEFFYHGYPVIKEYGITNADIASLLNELMRLGIVEVIKHLETSHRIILATFKVPKPPGWYLALSKSKQGVKP